MANVKFILARGVQRNAPQQSIRGILLDVEGACLRRGVDLDVDVEFGRAIALIVRVANRQVKADLILIRRARLNVVNRLRVQVQLIGARSWVDQQHAIGRVQRLIGHPFADQCADSIDCPVNDSIQQLIAVLTGTGS